MQLQFPSPGAMPRIVAANPQHQVLAGHISPWILRVLPWGRPLAVPAAPLSCCLRWLLLDGADGSDEGISPLQTEQQDEQCIRCCLAACIAAGAGSTIFLQVTAQGKKLRSDRGDRLLLAPCWQPGVPRSLLLLARAVTEGGIWGTMAISSTQPAQSHPTQP